MKNEIPGSLHQLGRLAQGVEPPPGVVVQGLLLLRAKGLEGFLRGFLGWLLSRLHAAGVLVFHGVTSFLFLFTEGYLGGFASVEQVNAPDAQPANNRWRMIVAGTPVLAEVSFSLSRNSDGTLRV